MHIAAFETRSWPEAARALGHTCVELPAPPASGSYETTLAQRIEHGRKLYAMLRDEPIELILDAHGDGMLFVDDPYEAGMDALLHHRLGVPLVSQWIETLRILFKKIDPTLLHEALQSPTWFKGVFTRGHMTEMKWAGVPGCFYLPLMYYRHVSAEKAAALTEPPKVRWDGPAVCFAGAQQSYYFAHSDGVDTRTQQPGAIALAALADGSAATFLDVYRRYGFGLKPAPDASPAERAACLRDYYARKMFFAAARNLGTRDRFILLLKRKLGDRFLLVGSDRWRDFYGLDVAPRVDNATYFDLLRTTPISINMVNGDNDTGLNTRHFEITALGGFLLSYHQPELEEHFEVGRECESFRNESELLDKIGYYCEHREERDRIARAGQQRTLNTHLGVHRLRQVIEQVQLEAARGPDHKAFTAADPGGGTVPPRALAG